MNQQQVAEQVPRADGSWLPKGLPQMNRSETVGVTWAFLWFFFLMTAYYVLRPIREAMGIAGDVKQLKWLFAFVFVSMLALVPLYSKIAGIIPRRRLVPILFRTFAVCLLFLALAINRAPIGYQPFVALVLFVWVTIFGLFAVSVFWSILADLFRSEQGKRFFGLIATGGSLGGLVGSATAFWLVEAIGISHLIFLPMLFMEACVVCFRGLERWAKRDGEERGVNSTGDQALGGSMFRAFAELVRSPYLVGICAYVACIPFSGTMIYMQQAAIVKAAIETDTDRTELFAQIDFSVQVLTLILQALAAGPLMQRCGMSVALLVLPMICLVSAIAMALNPVLAVLVVVVVVTRTAAYAIASPAREVMFTVVSREDKYKTKSLCDLAIYRGADAVSSQTYGLLKSLGVSVGGVSWLLVPIAIVWGALAIALGRAQTLRAKDLEAKQKGG